jgi:hypothetical protein
MADAPISKDVIYKLARLLDREKATYAFMGGVALNVWGIPRATFDLDVTLFVDEERSAHLIAALERDGWVVDEIYKRGHRDVVGGMPTLHAQLPVGPTMLTVDLFLATTPFLESTLTRRKHIDLGRGPISVVSAADLLLFKLVAGRRKDVVDIDNLLTVQGVPERDHLLTWAPRLGVAERLSTVLRERG